MDLDLDNLIRTRLVIARVGQMDRARWWNIQGILGMHGPMVLRRGFPTTHYFAQARIAFAVARQRCTELFAVEGCATLWALPAEIEAGVEEQWQRHLTAGDSWSAFFTSLADLETADAVAALTAFDLAPIGLGDKVAALRVSTGGQTVAVPGTHDCVTDELVALLAGAFAKGRVDAPVIPYARLG